MNNAELLSKYDNLLNNNICPFCKKKIGFSGSIHNENCIRIDLYRSAGRWTFFRIYSSENISFRIQSRLDFIEIAQDYLNKYVSDICVPSFDPFALSFDKLHQKLITIINFS